LELLGQLQAQTMITRQDVVKYVIIAGAIFAAFLAVLAVRRLALGAMKPPGPEGQLAELDRLCRQGAITQDEYHRGRRKILGVEESAPSDQGKAGQT
jgi:hypothetical protein